MSLYKIVRQKLYYLGYSENTIKIYLSVICDFEEGLNKHHSRLNAKDFQSYLDNCKFTSNSQQNIAISALKFSWEKALGKKYLKIDFKRPRRTRKLPRVIDAELLANKIVNIKNLKHRAILQLGLSCGLRVGEVVSLKWEHLDRKRNILKVVNGKGAKDRSTILNDNMINVLDRYYLKFKHIDKKLKEKEYVFTGQNNNQYSASSIQKIVKKYIDKNESYHLLRNSYATYAIDNGTELKPLSVSMGHNSTKTVEKYYFHQSTRTLKTIKQAL
jgi:site-specific recombinase XerD